jgi:pyrroline-5-carboxylate reductase
MAMPNTAVLVAVGVMITGPVAPVAPEDPDWASGLLTEPETEAPVFPELVALD